MTSPAPQNIQLTIRVTPALWRQMQTALSEHRTINELVRTAIRAYIDETVDTAGSRRHFTNRMNQRMNRLEALVIWNALQMQMLTARGHFTILDELAPEDAEAEPPTPDEQFRQSSDASKRVLAQFLEEQQAIITQLEQFLAKRQLAAAEKPPKRKA
jgi:hypothetical protein